MAAKQSSRKKRAKRPQKKRATRRKGSSKGRRWLPSFIPPSLPSLPADQVIDVGGMLLALAGVATLLAMLPSRHPSILEPWLALLTWLLGVLAPLVPLLLVAGGIWLVARRFVDTPSPPWHRLLGFGLLAAALIGGIGLIEGWDGRPVGSSSYAGAVGYGIFRALALAVGRWGAAVALLAGGTLALLFLLERSLADLAEGLRRLVPRPRPAPLYDWPEPGKDTARRQFRLPPVPPIVERSRSVVQRAVGRLLERRPTRATAAAQARPLAAKRAGPPAPAAAVARESLDDGWLLPPWEQFLSAGEDAAANLPSIRHKAAVIEETLSHFGVPAQVVEVNEGPVVTQFGVVPGTIRKTIRGEKREIRVKVSAITNLQNDLALALAAARIRVEAPVPGRGYVGIEVPNDESAVVTLRDTMESDAFRALEGGLPVALGRDVSGRPVVADLARMPHLLIAGATGAGKSVCLNAILSSLLCQFTPEQLKLLLVDPKMVELAGYNGIPHLISPVVTELERVVGLLRWTVNEMERRYRILSGNRVRHVVAYNERQRKKGEAELPYLVLVIDELADLMLSAADQVEEMICRLAQMARATGIHMVLATQRPSVNVVTGLIKANFPARIAFAVASNTDSRVILDRPGAETLLGRGDMLFMRADSAGLIRAQGCFVSDIELHSLTAYWQQQAAQRASAPAAAPTPEGAATPSAPSPVKAVDWAELLAEEDGSEDELLPRAREIVRDAGRASISMLQRRMRVGYARAARLVDLLEAEGSIGASNGPGKNRRVLAEEPDGDA